MNWRKKLAQTSSQPYDKLPTFIELTPQLDTQQSTVVSPDAYPLNIELDFGAGIHLRITRAG